MYKVCTNIKYANNLQNKCMISLPLCNLRSFKNTGSRKERSTRKPRPFLVCFLVVGQVSTNVQNVSKSIKIKIF